MAGPTRTGDPGIEIARGHIAGVSQYSKFGRNTIIASGVTADLWDGGHTVASGGDSLLWIPPTAARIHDLASSDAADAGTVLSSGTATSGSVITLVDTGADFVADSVGIGDIVLDDTQGIYGHVTAVTDLNTLTVVWFTKGGYQTDFSIAANDAYRIVTPASTGVAVVHINRGLSGAYGLQSEFVVLNGTSNVATALAYVNITRMRARLAGAAGDDGVSAGDIKATAQTDGTVTARILAGNNATFMAIDQIPDGKMAFLRSWGVTLLKATGASANADIVPMIKRWSEPWQSMTSASVLSTGTSHHHISAEYPQGMPPRTIIKLQAISGTNGLDLSGHFTLILVDI